MQVTGKRIRIRCGQGLGDAVYLQAVVGYLIKNGQQNLEVCTNWPDVFEHLEPHAVTGKDNVRRVVNPGGKFDIVPFSRMRIDFVAHYTGRKQVAGTSQMEDCFISATLSHKVTPELNWKVTDQALVDSIKKEAGARRIIFFQHLRPAMDRKDGFGNEMIPTPNSIRDVLNAMKREGDTFVVKVGLGESLDDVGYDLDLRNKLSVKQLLDVATVADLFVGQCSLIIPISECLQVPSVIVFGHGIRTSQHPFIRSICPEKLLLRHNRNGCLELGIYDDDRDIKTTVRAWFAGLGIG